jgi:hypothetical protein
MAYGSQQLDSAILAAAQPSNPFADSLHRLWMSLGASSHDTLD